MSNDTCILDASVRLLSLNPQNKFKIMQLADLHYEPNPNIIKLNQNITRNLLLLEKPDLVIFSGDQISGWKTDNYRELHEMVVQPLVELNIKWAYILGNHDIESDLSPQQILCLDSQYPLSMTLHTNLKNDDQLDYILPIHSSDFSTIQGWIMLLDASVMECNGVPGAGCVSNQQLNWLESNFTSIHQNKSSIAFFHQAMPEYNKLYHYYDTYGKRMESSGCSIENPGLFNLLKKFPVWGTSIGHDHNNEYTGKLDSLTLNYGRKTGHGSYGPDFVDRGARVFEFQGSTINTWIRTEKEVIYEQELHRPNPKKFLECGQEESWVLVIVLSVLLTICVFGAVGAAFLLKRRSNRVKLEDDTSPY